MLNLSLYTVETHRSNILQKLNLHSVPELILYAARKGVISRVPLWGEFAGYSESGDSFLEIIGIHRKAMDAIVSSVTICLSSQLKFSTNSFGSVISSMAKRTPSRPVPESLTPP